MGLVPSARTIAAACMALLALSPPARSDAQGGGRNGAGRVGAIASTACQSEARTRYSVEAVRVDRTHKAPKRTRYVRPSLASLPPGIVGQGLWVGTVLIDRAGKVANVFVNRAPKTTPPSSALNDVVVGAVRQWEFEPPSSPVCLGVTVIIDYS